MSVKRCTIHKIRLSDLEQSIADPALAALINDGWEVMTSVVLSDSGSPELIVLMSPPKESPNSRPVWFEVSLLVGLAALLALVAWAVVS